MLRTRVGAAVELLGREIAPPKADPEPVDPRARAARLVEEIAVPSGVELFGPGMASTAHVRIVPDELDLALLCLLENAVDAAATNGGAVRVRCAVRGGDMVALEIDDDGPGITPDALDHGFDAFFTTKPGHLGLGLPISRRIAYRWAGRVEVGPGSSGGTHATLLFPMERA
jgi:signal transduction histidine kinase